MASLKTIFDALSRVDGLTDALSIPNLIQFVQLTSLLKNEIIALLSSTHNLAESPDTLPGDIQVFLSASLGLSKKFIDGAWAALREICWEYSTGEAADTLKLHFMAHGLNRSFTEQMLFPPSQTCQTPNCVKRHKLLKRTLVQKVVLYTLNGAKPGIVSQFHCDSCRTSFHVNYSVYKGMRTYYEGIPGVIEVAEHHYIETKVLELFTTLMLVSWTSATNGARIYNTALANSDQWPDHPDWKDKSIELRNEYVWDGFVALALLRDCKRQSPPAVLCVPNTGTQNSRFDQAMKARNAWIHRFGQPEYAHYCDKCFRVWTDRGGRLYLVFDSTSLRGTMVEAVNRARITCCDVVSMTVTVRSQGCAITCQVPQFLEFLSSWVPQQELLDIRLISCGSKTEWVYDR